jgi:hypothetical protein
LIPKGSEIACIIQCGGIWFANGKFGVTWKLFQGVVKPTQTLAKGQCHIKLDAGVEVKKDDSLVEPNYDSDGESNVVVAPSVVTASASTSASAPEGQPESSGSVESHESSESTEPKDAPPPVKKVVKKKGSNV